jgi:hypothetical protein
MKSIAVSMVTITAAVVAAPVPNLLVEYLDATISPPSAVHGRDVRTLR